MPRASGASDRLDRAGSVGKGSLGRHSTSTDMSVGSTTTRHWVNSVSDIYGPDEIEELLEDLQRLEQAAFETEDIQDFDIDGSQVGHHHQGHAAGGKGGAEGHHHYHNPHRDHYYYYRHRGGGGVGGGRREGHVHNDAVDHRWATAPAASAVPPTNACPVPPAGGMPVAPVSPTFSVSSWDSHANYQYSRDDEEGDGAVVDDGDGLAANPPASVLRHWWRPWGDDSRSVMLCFCDITSFKSLRTWLRLLIMLTTLVFLLTLVTSFSGAVSVGHHPLTAALYARLPESHREWVHSRLRAAVFVAIFALLFTAACLILDISRLAALMPLHVDKLQSIVYFMLAVTFAITSSLLIEAHFEIGGDRTVSMIGQINEAMAEYSEYHEFTTDDGNDRSDEQSSEGDHDDEVSSSNGEAGIGGEEEVRRPVFPFWTKYHLLFAALFGFLCSLECFLYLLKRKRRRRHGQRQMKTENTEEHAPNCDQIILRDSTKPQLNHQESGGTSSSRQQSRQQHYIANDSYRQQQQLQHSSDKYSRMNHVPRTSSSGRIRSSTTTPTAIAMSAISQPVPTTMTVESTPGAAVPSGNPGGGDREWSEHKPSTNNINNPAKLGPAFNGNNVEVQQDGKNNHTSTMRGTRCRNNKPDVTPMAESSFTEMEAAAVVETSAPNTTGAIPKHKQHHKKRTKPTSSSTQLKKSSAASDDASRVETNGNHLDEIISLPLEDAPTTRGFSANGVKR